MKTLLLATLLFAAPAVADEKPTQREIDLTCERIHDIAAKTHEMRYLGVPLSKMLEDAPKIMREIAIEAYSLPAYGTEKAQLRDRREFALKKQLECLNTEWI